MQPKMIKQGVVFSGIDGLSFKTLPPTDGRPYVVTTIEIVNSTGVLRATRKGTHVSITPVNGSIEQWMSQGMDSIWSNVLSRIVIEWD